MKDGSLPYRKGEGRAGQGSMKGTTNVAYEMKRWTGFMKDEFAKWDNLGWEIEG